MKHHLLSILAAPSICLLSGCVKGPIDLRNAEVIDLTYSFDKQTVYWPNAPSGFQLTQLFRGDTDAGYYYTANSFAAPEHGGTHLDAPIHFARNRWTVEKIPLDRLLGPAVVIDVSEQAAADPDYRLTAADVSAWERRNGRIPAGAIVLLRTGWGRYWPEKKKYLGDDTPGEVSNLHFPSYGRESAELLVKERKAGVLGVDTASIDHGPSRDFIVHQIACDASVPGLENVANLERVPEKGAWIVALPMKIAGGSGAPARIVALLPR
jgi:kynurenine formamidase